MESDKRKKALEDWLRTHCSLPTMTWQAMPGDASLRRYFRVHAASNTWVAMDAPPPENCHTFVAIAAALRAQGLRAPEVVQADVTQGFLLLSDFGDQTYLQTLTIENSDALYSRALSALAVLQNCRQVANVTIPLFSAEFMWQEWAWHKEWFLTKLLGLSLTPSETSQLDECYGHLVQSALAQPQVFMHRDYHSANLMVLPNQEVGILDFQDAFIGPLTYDLVSLLRDCYIAWPTARVEKWVAIYLEKLQQQGLLLDAEMELFLQWFDWMGVQRHLKALLTFARKQVRDQQSNYLKHIPRTLNYLQEVSAKYSALAALHHFLRDRVTPALAKSLPTCAA